MKKHLQDSRLKMVGFDLWPEFVFSLETSRSADHVGNVRMKKESLILHVRKWRKKATIGMKESKWEYEIGEQFAPRNLDAEGLMESTSNPIFARKDTSLAFQWRVRNLPYPIETYDVTLNNDTRQVTVRTTNKKYYKKFDIPDMDRAQLPLEPANLSIAYGNNTLIITYKKPKEILQMEKEIQDEFKKLKASKEGDVDCTPS
ncbi:hypothetical protein FSP39_007738 [Pinctada imbricata]|uniref:Protein DPCD n=1 Tax=Pinctada imbricata TaxID=66713 RepID=A0AA89BUA8_PINIB|nr:hypothetical protein FSP39_007738 [Pinctada imbricata]